MGGTDATLANEGCKRRDLEPLDSMSSSPVERNVVNISITFLLFMLVFTLAAGDQPD